MPIDNQTYISAGLRKPPDARGAFGTVGRGRTPVTMGGKPGGVLACAGSCGKDGP
jgi:hypothetical protein